MGQCEYRAECLELGAFCRAVVLGIVAEDGGTVEGAVVFREVEPALEAVGAVTSDANAHNVRRAAGQRTTHQVPDMTLGATVLQPRI